MRRVLAAVATLLTAIVGLSLTTASAATLSLTTAPAHFFVEAAACAPGTVNGTPVIQATATPPGSGGSYNEVSLSNIPAACQGKDLPLEVFVHTTTGTLFYSGSSTVDGSTASVTVGQGNYTGSAVTAVVVRIGGWLFPTTWTAPLPPAPYSCEGATSTPAGTGGDCTIVVEWGSDWNDGGSRAGNIGLRVTTSAPNAIVTLDLSRSPFPGWQVRGFSTNGNWLPMPDYSCTELPIVRLYANPNTSATSNPVQLAYWENAGSAGVCPGP